MHDRPANLSLLFGMAVSIIVHLTVLIPLFFAAMTTAPEPREARAERPMEDVMPPERDEQSEEPRVGIERGTPSSVSWIGYEEYEQHLAQRAEFEQAAFTQDPVGAVPIEGEGGAAHDAVEVAEGSEAVDEPRDERETASSGADEREQESVALPVPGLPFMELLVSPRSLHDLVNEDADLPASKADESVDGEAEPVEESAEPDASATDAAGRDEDDREREAASGEESTQESASSAAPGEQREGEQSDKDSDPTSIIDVERDNWRMGKPLAARGVEIKPQRPHFTLLQMTTASPRNPIVRIRFNNRGIPIDASLLRTTADRSIDAAIIASLYRWRAEGEDIEQLGEEETFDLEVRIVLVQHRDGE